jgi:G3E family GTPase
MARPRNTPIPVAVIVGPRAAGKTTLINRLLETPAFADTAVILNDFGATALRGAAVEAAGDGIMALGSGCVCCSVRGALTDALESLLRDLDNRRIAAIGRVVVEADAAADPGAVLAAIERHPYLALRFVADGVVAVLDATTAVTALAGRADTVRQIAMADVIAVHRGEDDAGLRGPLRALNPTAAVVDAATAPPSAFLGHGAFDPALGDLDAWLAAPAPAAPGNPPAPLAGEAGRINAFRLTRNRAMPFAALDRFVEYLAVLQAPNLIRVRALVATGDGGAAVVEGVGGYFRPPLIVDIATKPAVRFAVVAHDLDRSTFEGYLDAFLGEARVDRPDAAALVDNPLAVAGFTARAGR